MAKHELSTENKILEAANSIFLQFGYLGTTIQQIATKAAVNTHIPYEKTYKQLTNYYPLILETEFRMSLF